MNSLDVQYQNLLKDILENGVTKDDRTGTGTISVFGRQIRHKMSEGFPILTTKKVPFKTMATELVWFLRGDTNIKYLVDNDCNIWNGDAYKQYLKSYMFSSNPISYKNNNPSEGACELDEFIEKMKTNEWFEKSHGGLGPIYGAQWRNWNSDYELGSGDVSHDQIANLIKTLKENPDSRRMMVNAWNVGEIDNMTLPPCHYGFQVYTRELSFEERWELAKRFGYVVEDATIPSADDQYSSINTREELNSMWNDRVLKTNLPTRAISLMWNQRSVDTFLGLPFNIASYGLLLEIIAKGVNMVPDELIGNLGDVHLYKNHIEQAKEQIKRTPFELPSVFINDEVKWQEGGCIPYYSPSDFELKGYKSHEKIKATLSN